MESSWTAMARITRLLGGEASCALAPRARVAAKAAMVVGIAALGPWSCEEIAAVDESKIPHDAEADATDGDSAVGVDAADEASDGVDAGHKPAEDASEPGKGG